MNEINAGDTAWVLVSAALVLLMTPALGFFYGGFVRRKNTLSTIMQSFIIVGVVSVLWVLWGYTLAFGPDKGGIIGSLEWFGLKGVGLEPNADYAATIPHQAFMVFQMMFAVITPALITGAFAERVKFSTMLVFIVIWVTVVYAPVAHWVWAPGGWLRDMGALDFAGGTVVHINAGFAALAAALVFRKRLGLGQVNMEPHNVTYIVLGASLLWFGWFGFNAGSALGAGALATSAFINTHVAAAMAAITWMTLSWWQTGKASVIGAAAGAVAGLVAITPASGFVTPMGALIIGLGAGIFCFLALQFRARIWKVDDSLDVWAVHGMGGVWGALATGIFATAAVNSLGKGLIDGNPGQLGTQALASVVVMAYSFFVSAIVLKALDMTMGLAVKTEDEEVGLDISQHGESAYILEQRS
ncbi:MAG: ammonium transporter [Dehalococcoidia bacterium]|nr:ammonium transporter [Dehalococcoidia bacterium]MSQ17133.1 ammonium transporter [Dehalococcoidia bacterium]